MSESNELVVLNNLNPVIIFTENGADPLLEAIKKEVSAFVPDISTVKGRKEIASLANKVAKSKTYLDELGKDLVSEWKEKSKKVDIERKKIRDTLDLLKEEVRRPLTEFEQKEESRIQKHELAIKAIELFMSVGTVSESVAIQAEIDKLVALATDDTFEEFKDRAQRAKYTSMTHLQAVMANRLQYEKEQEELKQFRIQEEARKIKEREEQIAKEAAEKAKAEADRIAQEEANKAKIAAEKLENEKQEAIRKQKQAEEDTRLAKEKAAQDKIESEKRAIAAAEKAESDKALAVQKAKEEAANLEKKRLEQEAKDTAKREANQKHLKTINNEVLTALVACTGIDEETAKKVITAIAKGEIPNVKINY